MVTGKYDEESAWVLAKTNASACLLVVIGGGQKGGGISLSMDLTRVTRETIHRKLPTLLRALADTIEEETEF